MHPLVRIFQCPLWVISGQTIPGQNPPLSALVQKRTNAGATGLSALCQYRTHAAQQMAALCDHFIDDGQRPGSKSEPEHLDGFEVKDLELADCTTGRSVGFSPLRIRAASTARKTKASMGL